MPTLYVLQTGQTTWEADSRIEPVEGAPLSERGLQAAADVAQELSKHDIVALYACGGQAETQTAQLLAEQAGVKVRLAGGLRELDYGLWQGLTIEEIRRRHPKLYRQWVESPATVRPPGGETLSEARDRLRSVLRRIIHRHKRGSALLVLRPVMFALFRCLAEGRELEDLWGGVDTKCSWCQYEMDGQSF